MGNDSAQVDAPVMGDRGFNPARCQCDNSLHRGVPMMCLMCSGPESEEKIAALIAHLAAQVQA